MATCQVCGNEYDKTFEVRASERSGVFDSFECAISAMAPTCSRCGTRIIGHGVESDGRMYCCANCAHLEGVAGAVDRIDRVAS